MNFNNNQYATIKTKAAYIEVEYIFPIMSNCHKSPLIYCLDLIDINSRLDAQLLYNKIRGFISISLYNISYKTITACSIIKSINFN